MEGGGGEEVVLPGRRLKQLLACVCVRVCVASFCYTV